MGVLTSAAGELALGRVAGEGLGVGASSFGACSGKGMGEGDGWRARPPCPARDFEEFLMVRKIQLQHTELLIHPEQKKTKKTLITTTKDWKTLESAHTLSPCYLSRPSIELPLSRVVLRPCVLRPLRSLGFKSSLFVFISQLYCTLNSTQPNTGHFVNDHPSPQRNP